MTRNYLFLLPLLALAACTEQKNEVQECAARALSEARIHLTQKQFDAARDSIMSIRKNYPTAIDVRRRAILLLDSIEMQAAEDSALYAAGDERERLDMKAQFFARKLEEDKKR